MNPRQNTATPEDLAWAAVAPAHAMLTPGGELLTLVLGPRLVMPKTKSIVTIRDNMIHHLVNVTNVYNPGAAAFSRQMADPHRVVIRSPAGVVFLDSIVNTKNKTFTLDAFYRHGPRNMLQPRGRTNAVASRVVFQMGNESSGNVAYTFSDNDVAAGQGVPSRQIVKMGVITFRNNHPREILKRIEFY